MGRFEIYKRNKMKVQKSNKSWKEGITKFSDMSHEEFKQKYLNLNNQLDRQLNLKKVTVPPKRVGQDPDYFNWVDEGAFTAVKDQGQCGSCWTFSVIGCLEGLYYIEKNQNLRFSEQMIVDCDDEEEGCNGGWMDEALFWINKYGIMLEDDYPYEGIDDQCRSDPSKMITDFAWTPFRYDGDDEEIIKGFLLDAPLSVGLNADPLQYYVGGIIDADQYECDPTIINHGVVLVGYGTEDGQDYWIVRNSWSADWGEDGYFRMARGKGTCGINTCVAGAQQA